GADVRAPARAAALVSGRQRRLGVVPRSRAGPVADQRDRRAQAGCDVDRRSGRPHRAGPRAGRLGRQGSGRLEEDDGGAAEGGGTRAEGAAPAPRRLGARRLQSAAHDQEGELLQRRRGGFPELGDRAAMTSAGGRTLLDMNRYQWTVLFAAWLGWGF